MQESGETEALWKRRSNDRNAMTQVPGPKKGPRRPPRIGRDWLTKLPRIRFLSQSTELDHAIKENLPEGQRYVGLAAASVEQAAFMQESERGKNPRRWLPSSRDQRLAGKEQAYLIIYGVQDLDESRFLAGMDIRIAADRRDMPLEHVGQDPKILAPRRHVTSTRHSVSLAR